MNAAHKKTPTTGPRFAMPMAQAEAMGRTSASAGLSLDVVRAQLAAQGFQVGGLTECRVAQAHRAQVARG